MCDSCTKAMLASTWGNIRCDCGIVYYKGKEIKGE